MHPDQATITFQCEDTYVTAHTSTPFREDTVTSEREQQYHHLVAPLRLRGLVCTVEYGLSDRIVRAELPDGSALIISPPQEPATDHPPGYPESWLVTRGHPDDSTFHEVVYNSEPDGPHAPYGGSIPHLLAGIGTRLDQLGLPPSPGPQQLAREDAIHRLPAAMTDPADQRRAVTRALGMLHTEAIFGISSDPDLLNPDPPCPGTRGTSLGDLSRSIQTAGHTSEVVAALSELTAPGDGILQQVVDSLTATADWWKELGEPTDRHHADRLRHITEQLDSYAVEIRSLRDGLADRHTSHPQHTWSDQSVSLEPVVPRVTAALSTSPGVRRTTPTTATLNPAVRPGPPPPARPSSAPGL
ncbi:MULTISPECIES: hypothetical protein [unclassified Streptomyces]|uniref:hypothetical protein n=1 Tax=unclassified Streptomyces TaxID=2593676 RepID=UPI0037F835D1